MTEPKISITIRLDPQVLKFFKRGGAGYQTRISEALSQIVERAERPYDDYRNAL